MKNKILTHLAGGQTGAGVERSSDMKGVKGKAHYGCCLQFSKTAEEIASMVSSWFIKFISEDFA